MGFWSLFKSALYLNPLFISVAIIDELYNIERAIRGIKEDE
jgi:hypothetical protein